MIVVHLRDFGNRGSVEGTSHYEAEVMPRVGELILTADAGLYEVREVCYVLSRMFTKPSGHVAAIDAFVSKREP